jgi:hypothetical protein
MDAVAAIEMLMGARGCVNVAAEIDGVGWAAGTLRKDWITKLRGIRPAPATAERGSRASTQEGEHSCWGQNVATRQRVGIYEQKCRL